MRTNIEDPILNAARRIELNRSKAISSPTYAAFINLNCQGDRVVDFGFVIHSQETSNLDLVSSHETIVKISNSVLAIDIVNFEGRKFENSSYLIANLLGLGKIDLAKLLNNDYHEYDLFYAGNVIEHLSNPGELFDLANLLLCPGGKLVISTVNPLWFIGLWDRITLNYQSNCIDHVSLIGPQELFEFANRFDFFIESWNYVGIQNMVDKFQPGGRVKGRLVGLLYGFIRKYNLASANNLVGVVMVKKSVA